MERKFSKEVCTEVKRDYNYEFKTQALNDLCDVVFVSEEKVVCNDLGSFITKVTFDKSVDYQYTAELMFALDAVEDYIYDNERYHPDVISSLRDAYDHVRGMANIIQDPERCIYVKEFFDKVNKERNTILLNKLPKLLSNIDNFITNCLIDEDKERLKRIKNKLDEIYSTGICPFGVHIFDYLIDEAINIMCFKN